MSEGYLISILSLPFTSLHFSYISHCGKRNDSKLGALLLSWVLIEIHMALKCIWRNWSRVQSDKDTDQSVWSRLLLIFVSNHILFLFLRGWRVRRSTCFRKGCLKVSGSTLHSWLLLFNSKSPAARLPPSFLLSCLRFEFWVFLVGKCFDVITVSWFWLLMKWGSWLSFCKFRNHSS